MKMVKTRDMFQNRFLGLHDGLGVLGEGKGDIKKDSQFPDLHNWMDGDHFH